ncbi:hypothetical protein KDAU_29830 [Dictyobacter aurantiacus]|uniref:Uncharacterized protein n=1 Tax=Dictyobacter aurantiacus TaxID=1936993 RepID=A0A401ZFJ2_9CHLR|nr:hypothetical protein KDAU_29830 [Dictyobacter aurantiacus]
MWRADARHMYQLKNRCGRVADARAGALTCPQGDKSKTYFPSFCGIIKVIYASSLNIF